MRLKRRINGQLARLKRPDAAGNARPLVKYVSHGAGSGLLRDPLDRRTRVGKAYHAHLAALAAHVGGDPNTVEIELIDQAARLALLVDIAWGETVRTGVVSDGQLSPAFAAFLAAARDQRAVLTLIGLERRIKDVSLRDLLPTGNAE
jgi:hypothetical protein